MGNYANIVAGPATLAFNSVDLGFTKDGIRLRMEREYIDVPADQVKGIVAKPKSIERFYVATTLLECTLANLEIAWDQASGSLGCNTSNEQQLVIVGKAPSDVTRTFTLPRAVSHNNTEINYGHENEASLEVEFECLKQNSGSFGSVVEA